MHHLLNYQKKQVVSFYFHTKLLKKWVMDQNQAMIF